MTPTPSSRGALVRPVAAVDFAEVDDRGAPGSRLRLGGQLLHHVQSQTQGALALEQSIAGAGQVALFDDHVHPCGVGHDSAISRRLRRTRLRVSSM